jgi:hypothetical protein
MIPRHNRSRRGACPRRPVGDGRAPPATATPSLVGRPGPHHPGPQLLRRDHLDARTSTPWRLLPAQELGCGSPATAWRRLNEWATAGCSSNSTWRCWTGSVWLAGWTGRARVWTRPACASNAGDHIGASPVDRGKPGSKIHLACEGGGLPLTAVVTAANIPRRHHARRGLGRCSCGADPSRPAADPTRQAGR